MTVGTFWFVYKSIMHYLVTYGGQRDSHIKIAINLQLCFEFFNAFLTLLRQLLVGFYLFFVTLCFLLHRFTLLFCCVVLCLQGFYFFL